MPLQQLDFARRRLPRHRPVARLRASRVVHPGNQGQDLVRQAASQRPRRRRCARSPRAPPAPARRTTSCSIPAWTRSSAAATYRHNRLVQGGVNVGAGRVKAPALVAASGLPTGHNGRVKVDQHLRALDHPEIYACGDLASVVDPRSGRTLPPLAQVAWRRPRPSPRPRRRTGRQAAGGVLVLRQGVHRLGRPRRGVAEIAGITTGGRLAHALKDAIEWEYRQFVKHLRG
jgi:hypothetical protein